MEIRVIKEAMATRSGKNTSGATLSEGTIVKAKASPTIVDEIDGASAATDAFLGVVCDDDILNGYWGYYQTFGLAKVLAGDTVAIGSWVTSDASGAGVTAVAGNVCIGVAITLGTAAEYFEVWMGSSAGHSDVEGVETINKSGETPLAGAVTVSEGTGITLTQAAQDIEVANAGILSFAKSGESALTGAVTVSEGTGITLTQAAQDIEVANAGVLTVNAAGETPLVGAITITGGSGITLTQSGQDISIALTE